MFRVACSLVVAAFLSLTILGLETLRSPSGGHGRELTDTHLRGLAGGTGPRWCYVHPICDNYPDACMNYNPSEDCDEPFEVDKVCAVPELPKYAEWCNPEFGNELCDGGAGELVVLCFTRHQCICKVMGGFYTCKYDKELPPVLLTAPIDDLNCAYELPW